VEIREAVSNRTKCLHCDERATWTIAIANTVIPLCDSCCDELSQIAGDKGSTHASMVRIAEIVALWKVGRDG